MPDIAANNKRIAKNTLMLYIRMMLTMAVSLYTSRVVLNTLGEVDYGIYNVVGGVVSMFSVISGSLSAAITRFITFELGTGNNDNLNKIFCTSVTIQIIIAIIILLLAELLGIWFLNTKMNIPDYRMEAANWVLQFSIVTFIINLISVPYNASIIAHEKMSVFAFISVLDALCKLLIAYLITISPIDHLIFYSILITFSALVVRYTYRKYCKKHFEECSYRLIIDKSLFKKMFSFAGWNFIGSSAGILRDQGGNIIINLFCGPAVNASRAIANQVSVAVQNFVSSFMTAVNPQITKSYAISDVKYMMTLVFQSSRLSYYMLLLISIPIILNAEFLLQVWLKNVPSYSVIFVQLMLILAMSETISYPLITAMLATGKIRNYQIVVGGLQLLNLPISYFLLSLKFHPQVVIIVAIVISQICLFARLFMLKKMINFSIKDFINKVYVNILSVTIIAVTFPVLTLILANNLISQFFISSIVSILFSFIAILYVGCTRVERNLLKKKILEAKIKIIKW